MEENNKLKAFIGDLIGDSYEVIREKPAFAFVQLLSKDLATVLDVSGDANRIIVYFNEDKLSKEDFIAKIEKDTSFIGYIVK